jgi:CBS-domain-containing membrane protein
MEFYSGAEKSPMRAYEIMTPQVITVGPETAVSDAARLMLQHHVSGLPVVDAKGGLIGIVSEGDFLRRAETATQHRRGHTRRPNYCADPTRLSSSSGSTHVKLDALLVLPPVYFGN